MKRSGRLLFAALLLMGMIGCGSVGKNFDENRVQDIQNKHTSKTQILEWFGSPFKEGTENGHEMWTYQLDQYKLGKTESKDLVILFDKNNRVKAYRYTSSLGAK